MNCERKNTDELFVSTEYNDSVSFWKTCKVAEEFISVRNFTDTSSDESFSQNFSYDTFSNSTYFERAILNLDNELIICIAIQSHYKKLLLFKQSQQDI